MELLIECSVIILTTHSAYLSTHYTLSSALSHHTTFYKQSPITLYHYTSGYGDGYVPPRLGTHVIFIFSSIYLSSSLSLFFLFHIHSITTLFFNYIQFSHKKPFLIFTFILTFLIQHSPTFYFIHFIHFINSFLQLVKILPMMK